MPIKNTAVVTLAVCMSNMPVHAKQCTDVELDAANRVFERAADNTDLLERSLIVMQALRQCKKYHWWLELGQLQEQQQYWYEAADAYLKARNFYVPDNDGRMPAAEIQMRAVASYKLAWAYWNTNQRAKALIMIDDARGGFEITGAAVPARLIELQGIIDDAFTQSDSILLAEAINLQRAMSVRGVGIRPRPKVALTTVSNSPSHNKAQAQIQNQFSAFSAENIQARINLQVLFDVNSDHLLPGGIDQIDRMAATIDKLGLTDDYTVVVVGHTDSRGSTQYNLELSQRRADTVLHYLTDRIASDVAIKSQGVGESRLRYPGDSVHEHRRNRRVELVLRKEQ